jgi:hypothetical protein
MALTSQHPKALQFMLLVTEELQKLSEAEEVLVTILLLTMAMAMSHYMPT